jgi:hypothetical protein
MKTHDEKVNVSDQISRRKILQSGGAAALLLGTNPLGLEGAQSTPPPVNYGSGDGKTPLVPETIFPLLAAWLLMTTNGPFNVDAALLSCVANLHPTTANRLKTLYDENAKAFDPVNTLFETIAKEFSGGIEPYSGGQCPKYPDTVTPVAALYGTKTTIVCTASARPDRKKSKRK